MEYDRESLEKSRYEYKSLEILEYRITQFTWTRVVLESNIINYIYFGGREILRINWFKRVLKFATYLKNRKQLYVNSINLVS